MFKLFIFINIFWLSTLNYRHCYGQNLDQNHPNLLNHPQSIQQQEPIILPNYDEIKENIINNSENKDDVDDDNQMPEVESKKNNVVFQSISSFTIEYGLTTFPDRPLQIIRPDESHKNLVIVEENIQYLHSIIEPVSVISVVGKYHSGKSYLMNQLMGKSKGFGIGSKVTPETMGIWLWGKPIKFGTNQNQNHWTLMLDTEGFAATNISENYDAKIFAVSTLLSSILLYNSVKIIDQSDIDYLELLARRTQLFALKAVMSPRTNLNNISNSVDDRQQQNDNKDSLIESLDAQILQFPSLLWIIQDFVQEIENESNCKNWLIKLLSTHTRETETYSISLKDIFPSVDCHTLFIPSASKHLLTDLSRADENDLLLEYRNERDELIKKLSQIIRPKYRNRIPMTGSDLVHILRMLVNAANTGSLTEIPNRWDTFLDRLKQSSIEECFKFYQTYMNNLIIDQLQNEPVSMAYLHEWHKVSLDKSITLLRNLLQGLESHFELSRQQLNDQITNSYIVIKTINKQKIQMKIFAIRKKFENAITEEFAKLKLPILSEEIRNFSKIQKANISENFFNEFENLLPKEDLANDLDHLYRFIDLTTDSTILENIKHLDKFFDEQIKTSLNDGFSKLQINTVRPKLYKKFLEYLNELDANTRQMFENRCRKYANEIELYNSNLFKLNAMIDEKKRLILEDQELAVGEFLRKELQLCSTEFDYRISNDKLKFPIDLERFDEIIEQESKRITNNCIQPLNVYADYQTYQNIINEQYNYMNELIRKNQKQNLEAFKKEVELPLKTAKQIIIKSKDLHSTYFRFKNFIYDVCIIQLNQGLAKEWSQTLKNKIVDSFIKDDSELFDLLESKRCLWSTIVGFFQWIFSLFGY